MPHYTELEKKILEVFVTSATDSIYAVRNTVPPELFGAFGSYFSRNPKDFREHLLDAIKGQIEDEKTKVSEEDLMWLAERKFREPSDAIERGLEKSQNFFRTWYGKYSHKSIANTVWIPMVATNVSQMFARELAYDQLAFFIEQSTRFVKFDSANMFKDDDVMKSHLKDVYESTLTSLAVAYDALTKECEAYYGEIVPFENWLKQQDEKTLKSSEKSKQAKYEREIRGKALDVSRFLLPQATKTNIAWILDARSIEHDVAAWKGHPLKEIRGDAELIEKHAGQIAESLLKYTEMNPYCGEQYRNYDGALPSEEPKSFGKGVDIISYDHDGLDKSVAHILTRHNRGGAFAQRYGQVKKMSWEEKMIILQRITQNRGMHDEWVELDEDFDMVNMNFEIRTDIGAIRDWRRHQKWNRGEALYSLDNGVHKPKIIADMSQKAGSIFDNAIEVAHDAERKIREKFPHQAQYVIPMAAMHAIRMSAGLDQLQYMIYTRSTPQGNFSYREDAFNIAEAVLKIYPWIIGLKEYPEGKDVREVYAKAPLKTILRLQTGETALHQ